MKHATSILAVLFLVACETSGGGPEGQPTPPSGPASAAAPRPWTQKFMAPAVLVAREVSIEGPSGLLDHVALQVDPSVHEYTVRTVPEGLLQELTFKQGTAGAVLRGQLDQLVIAAEQRLRVLERPGDVPVVVLASGAASWSTPDGQEQRGESLRLSGAEPR